MLSKAIRSISTVDALETVDNKRYAGPAEIDRRLNVKIGNTTIRGTEVRYIMLSDEETMKVLRGLKQIEENA